MLFTTFEFAEVASCFVAQCHLRVSSDSLVKFWLNIVYICLNLGKFSKSGLVERSLNLFVVEIMFS